MSETDSLKSSDVVESLQLLRSDDPADRQRGIAGLTDVSDDPRVQQVFEYLYERDPDPGVREAVWRVLSRQGPSVPSPTPPPKRAAARRRTPAPRATFLLDPGNRAQVRRYQGARPAGAGRGSRALSWLIGLLLLAAGFLWGLAAPSWYDWYRLRADGMRTDAAVTGLSAPSDASDSAPYVAAYRFRLTGADDADDASGDEPPVFFGQQRIRPDQRDWLADEDTRTVPVIYLPDDPSVSRLDLVTPDDTRRERLAILAVGATAIALLIGVIGWIARLPSRGALRGALLRGQVIAAQAATSADKNRRVTVRFRFRSPGGRVITSEATRVRGDLSPATLPEPGTPVLVEYHNERRFRLL